MLNFRRNLLAAAVATALGINADMAGAAPYRGEFDPVHFSGQYVINVSPTCLLTDGWHANAGICSATLLSTFADVTALPTDTPNFNGHLVFAPPPISSSAELFGIFVYGGKIDSFDTALLPFVSSSPSTTDNWWLEFVSGQMPCTICIQQFDTSLRGVYLFANSMADPVAMAQYTGPAIDLAVPEPGTLGLMLGAFGGGWLARRRRRRERDPPPD
jgi:hypothetical protein